MPPLVSRVHDVIVIGGGVVGCAVGWRLAQAGRRVALVERGRVGGEASSAAGGLLSPIATDRPPHLLAFWNRSNRTYADFVDDLRAATDQAFDYRRCGRVVVAIDEREVEALHREFLLQAPADIPARWIDGSEARAIEPLLSGDVQAAIHFPEHGLVHNPRLTRALARALQRAGGRVLEHCLVTGLAIDHGRVVGVETATGRISAPRVVVCAGSWSGLIDPRCPQPIRPVKGQMVVVDLGAEALRCSVGGPGAGVLPRTEGQTLIGATIEDVGFDKDVVMGAIAALFERSARVVPSLRGARLVDCWAGLRPTTPDRGPLIGADLEMVGLYWATGHGTMGILTAPTTAQAITDLIETGQSSIEIDGFAPGRFAHVR